jgi:hypothetical protein
VGGATSKRWRRVLALACVLLFSSVNLFRVGWNGGAACARGGTGTRIQISVYCEKQLVTDFTGKRENQ